MIKFIHKSNKINKYCFSTLATKCYNFLIESNLQNKLEFINELKNQKLESLRHPLYNNEIDSKLPKNLRYAFPSELILGSPKEITEFIKGMHPFIYPNLKQKFILKEHKIHSKIVMLHAIAHIEYNAMNIYIDTVYKFLHDQSLPVEFFQDMLDIAIEEALHFTMLNDKLKYDGFGYGKILGHRNLVQDTTKTDEDILKRIAVTTLVHEAKGIDSGPRLLIKIRSFQDKQAETILKRILTDEEKHVSHGLKWFKYFCEKKNVNPRKKFLEILNELDIKLIPPFNDSGRERAGFEKEWYQIGLQSDI